ncbi:hypothetical protein VTJ49DRAFT_4607 [Mycothermus thermophilus]|uniref:Uncharacterized protein n=1 Tax=Humicola insolens TaxID=85995 RepID=A0ABR3V537_HUMIN
MNAAASPIAIPAPSPRRTPNMMGLSRLVTAQEELFASLNATLAKNNINGQLDLSTPVRHIPENDYTVPAPPPPSPVGFREHCGCETDVG